jgi:hypothetical protein
MNEEARVHLSVNYASVSPSSISDISGEKGLTIEIFVYYDPILSNVC